MRSILAVGVAMPAVLLLGAGVQPQVDSVLVGDFEGPVAKNGLPEGWSELTFPSIEKHTSYSVVAAEAPGGGDQPPNHYLHANSPASASALLRPVDVDVKKLPVLKWRWRIRATVPKGDARSKDTDDYAARIYVNFKYEPDRVGRLTRIEYALARRRLGQYPPLCSLNYIWANKLKEGTFIPNAYSDRAMMVAVESGNARAGEWLEEERNVYEDYKKAFDGEPPPITGVAVMVDTDNTGGSAEADFDDIRFERPPPKNESKPEAEAPD